MKKAIGAFIIVLFCLNFGLNNALGEEAFTWQDCVKEAAKNHPDLIAAKEVVNESKANKEITQSGLGPQITSQLSTTYQKAGSGSGTSVSKGSKTSTTNAYSATGTQVLFDGFKTIDNTMAATETIKSSQFAYKFTSSQVRQRLRTAFANLLSSQELINVTQQIYDIRKKNLDLIKLRYDSGIEHKGALLMAEADLAQAEYDIKQAKRDKKVAQSQLIKEMGRYEFVPLQVKGTFDVKVPVDRKPDFIAIAINNPSVKKLLAQTKAAYYNVRAAQADFFPTVSTTGSAGRSDPRWLPQTNNWSMGITISLPIFESGLRIYQVNLAKAQLRQAEQTERSTKDSVLVSLEQTWQALVDAVEKVGVQSKFLTADEERSSIANAQYSVGFITFDNWTIIQDNLVSSKTNYLNAEANALIAEAAWIQAKGETLEYEQ